MSVVAVDGQHQQAVNPLALAIREFQGSLSKEENAALLAHSSTGLDATGVLSFTAEIDRVNANRRSRCVSSRLFGILESVREFSGVADTFVSAHPDVAALVWGSLKFALLTINNAVSFFDKLSETFLRLGACCPRYSEYRLVFPDSLRLQNSLCAFYAVIVRFCTKALNAINTPGTTLTRALWKPFEKEFSVFEYDLKRLSVDLRDEIRLAAEQAASKEREAATRERSYGKSFRAEMRKASQAKSERQLKKDRANAIIAKVKLVERLSTYDHIAALKRLRKKRYGSTGSWLYQTDEFSAWLSEKHSSLLCLTGILGSGKSIVTAAAVDKIICELRTPGTRIAFFFCEPEFAKSLDGVVILSCLIRQFIDIQKLDNDLEERLTTLLESTYPDVYELEPILCLALHKLSAATFIIIDGLDACIPSDAEAILGILSRVVERVTPTVKLFISTRESLMNEISKSFKAYQHMTTAHSEAQTDIPLYIDRILKEKIDRSYLILGDVQLEQEIKNALTGGANGMFLWVTLQINTLCRQISDANIRASLASLPSGLPETYQQILRRIKTESTADTVYKIFQWVAVSSRPMHLEELREAIAIDPGDLSFPRDRLVNQFDRLVSWCGDLVTLDEDELVVQFAHHSIKDFLTSSNPYESDFQFKLSNADHVVGVACITYLNFTDFERQLVEASQTYSTFQPADLVEATATTTESSLFKYGARLASRYQKRKSKFDAMRHFSNIRTGKGESYLSTLYTRYHFLSYAVENWPKHTGQFFLMHSFPTQPVGGVPDWNLQCDRRFERHRDLWVEMIITRHPIASPFWYPGDRERRTAMIQNLILDFKCLSLVDFIDPQHIVEDESIAAVLRNDVDLFPLALEASKRRLWTIFEALISKYPSTLLATKATARLYVAARIGNIQEIHILQRMGADLTVGPSTSEPYFPLYLAAGNGHLSVVDKLLSAGARVNGIIHARDSARGGEMAIHSAVRGGHLEVVRCLVQHHLLRNPPTDYERFMPYALKSAIACEFIEVTKELFKLGLDLDYILHDMGGSLRALRLAKSEQSLSIQTVLGKLYYEVIFATNEGAVLKNSRNTSSLIRKEKQIIIRITPVATNKSPFEGDWAMYSKSASGTLRVPRNDVAEWHLNFKQGRSGQRWIGTADFDDAEAMSSVGIGSRMCLHEHGEMQPNHSPRPGPGSTYESDIEKELKRSGWI